MTRVRLYGHARGEHSFAQVTRGMQRALEAMGEAAGFHAVDLEGEDELGTVVSPVSLNIGAPQGLLQAHRYGEHKSHWLLLAPNSEGLPVGLLKGLREPSDILPHGLLTGGLLAPSTWAANVLRRAAPDLPVIVAPHGVMPDVHRTDPEARGTARITYDTGGRFDVLHMTSSEHERKGTKLLLRAWKTLKDKKRLPAAALLHVVMNPMHMTRLEWWCREVGITEKDVARYGGLAQSQHQIASFYSLMHMVCQPSRGEGFGLVPLEALACGVPVIATACTGHSEYLGTAPPGFKEVPHGELTPMDDYPGSLAPSVRVADLEDAIAEAYPRWRQLSEGAEENAEALRTEWSWEKKNVPALKKMIQEAETHVRTTTG